MNEDTNVQDKVLEGQPESDLHTEAKPTEEVTSEDKSRTQEQFEKLTARNRELSEKLKAYEAQQVKESVLDSLKPKAPPVLNQQIQPSQEAGLVDEEGYLNPNVLQRELAEAKKKAQLAEDQARRAAERFERYEETSQIKIAHERFPQLDPNSDKFDRKFYEQTRKELVYQMINGEKDVLKAAAAVSEYYQPKNEEDAKSKVEQEQVAEAKANINAGMRRSASPQVGTYTEMDDNSLVKRVQKGDRLALAERLKRAGY